MWYEIKIIDGAICGMKSYGTICGMKIELYVI